jgi:hypothetical protein
MICLSFPSLLKMIALAGRWRLTPVILATQEAEIRKIRVGSQPGQIVLKSLAGKNPSQKRAVEWLKV